MFQLCKIIIKHTSERYFTESNVLHMGDTFFNGRYPFIDIDSGGSSSIPGKLSSRKTVSVLLKFKLKDNYFWLHFHRTIIPFYRAGSCT